MLHKSKPIHAASLPMSHMRKAQIIQLEGGGPALHYKDISQPYLDQSQATHGYLTVGVQPGRTNLFGAGSRMMFHCIADRCKKRDMNSGEKMSGEHEPHLYFFYFFIYISLIVECRGRQGMGTYLLSTQPGAKSPTTWY